MSAVVAVILGVVGFWLLAGLGFSFAWIVDRHPWVLGVVFFSFFGGLIGFAIYNDFIATG